MATKTVRKRASRPRNIVGKPAAKIPAKKAKAESAKAKQPAIKKVMGNATVDPNQKNLPIVEDERVVPIETAIKEYLKMKSQRSSLKEQMDILVSKLPPLFKKHDLNNYSCCGHTITVMHGADEVKIKKAKTQ